MKIDHIAIWAHDLERLKDFYVKYFGMTCGEKYVNPTKQYSSYFLSFEGAETRIEIMQRPDIVESVQKQSATLGITHFSIALDEQGRSGQPYRTASFRRLQNCGRTPHHRGRLLRKCSGRLRRKLG
jgi:catechol 2,3-dioxygenase-like lactoylglutathione lyase family enzyme